MTLASKMAMRATKMALLLGTCGLLLVACDDNGPLPGVFVDGGTNADANGGSPGRGGSSGSGTGGGAGGTAGQGGAGGTAGQGGAGGTTMTGQGGAGGGMTGAGGGTAGAGGGTAGTGGTVGTGSGGRGGAGTGGTGGVVGGGVGASCGGFRPAPVPGCKAGLFCELKPDTCNIIADAPGTCAEIPNACTLEYNPVCGCDNMTYGNDCARRAAGVSRANTGPCKTAPGVSKACGGIAGIACASGLFCELREGTCGAADQPGICQAVPDACTKEYAPVCGCDGVTYGNDCMRRAAGVAKKANGAC